MEIKTSYDLEDRLIRFGGDVVLFTNTIKRDIAGKHLTDQLIRSATSPALNYAESQSASSNRDFIHKNTIAVKELKESRANLKILNYIGYGDRSVIQNVMMECEQLIAILSKVIVNKKART